MSLGLNELNICHLYNLPFTSSFSYFSSVKGDVPAITNALNMEWPNDLDRSNMKSFVTEVSGSCGPFLHSGPRLVSPGLYHGPRGRPQDPEHLSQEPSSPGVTRRVAKKVSSKTKQRPESAESEHSGHPSRPHHDSRPKHGHKERTGRPKCAVMSFHEEVYTAIMADPETAAPATIPLGLEACLNNFSRRGRSLLAEYLKRRPGAHRYYPYPGVDIEGAEEPPVRIIAEVCPGTTNVLLLRHSDEWTGDSWWRHQMETFSALLALCAGNSPVTGEFSRTKASDAELCFLWSAPE